ncbi:acetate--CoA ligase family protein [Planktotalea sp.]|uniref:acetate--CoA ligase family protein n=1 Tax=Planktotalea sp. TaxID=2029877 RepID=UPI0025EDF10A|nr:acetate--CoA ligase family protein [Planktotalea sp.]
MTASNSGLARLLRPQSIAIVGGGAWCHNVIKTCESIGFEGDIWPVHPTKAEVAGRPAFPSIDALPKAPDASFLGVNRYTTIECLSALSKRGAGGAVCFASGFAEATAELSDGADLQAQLLNAAGSMTVLGPNCYGLLNYLDGVALWPDQHGGERVESGVVIITQSSNIAINLTMQNRALPIAYMVTPGNQAQTDIAEIGMELLLDPRVTALGLHIEGISDIRSLERLSKLAHQLGKPICALKIGTSEQAQLASVSHTASLAGSHTGARALLKRLGIAQPQDLGTFLELLKIWHVAGPLKSSQIASASCSGGEASLMADLGQSEGVSYPPLNQRQTTALRATLGPKVALANPLDYHTYIWADQTAMRATFSALFGAELGMGIVVLDFPRPDRCTLADWDIALKAIIQTAKDSSVPVAVLASLPDTLPEDIARTLLNEGVIPLTGMDHALRAIALAQAQAFDASPVLEPAPPTNTRVFSEDEAKASLANFGLKVPRSCVVTTPQNMEQAAQSLSAPWVLKGTGLAHKSEAGAVKVGLNTPDALQTAARHMNCTTYLVEEMVQGAIIELLVAVTLDPAHGYVLTLGAGGTQTELLNDTASLLLPVYKTDVADALGTLRCAPVLDGYRGSPAIDRTALWRAIDAVQTYVIAHHGQIQEVEINPMMCTPNSAIAVDALIVQGDMP